MVGFITGAGKIFLFHLDSIGTIVGLFILTPRRQRDGKYKEYDVFYSLFFTGLVKISL